VPANRPLLAFVAGLFRDWNEVDARAPDTDEIAATRLGESHEHLLLTDWSGSPFERTAGIAWRPRLEPRRMPMSDEVQPRVEVITSVQRRRRWSVAEKVRLVEETLQAGMSVSLVARLHGVSPSLLFKWRRLMAEGGREAVRVDDEVVGATKVRQLEERIRELERLLGRKTLEVEVLEEALAASRAKKPTLRWPPLPREGSR
jgi:transposase